MHRPRSLTFIVFALGILLAGCSDDTPVDAPSGELSDSQMALIALDSDTVTEEILNEQLGAMPAVAAAFSSMAAITEEIAFSRSRSCPAGGETSVEGTLQRMLDPDTGLMEASFSGTRTRSDCAFVQNELVVTVNGSATLEWFRRRIDGLPDGPQTTSVAGFVDVTRSDGAERSCEFSFDFVRDPSEGIRSMSGTMCGVSVTRTVSWNPGG